MRTHNYRLRTGNPMAGQVLSFRCTGIALELESLFTLENNLISVENEQMTITI